MYVGERMSVSPRTPAHQRHCCYHLHDCHYCHSPPSPPSPPSSPSSTSPLVVPVLPSGTTTLSSSFVVVWPHYCRHKPSVVCVSMEEVFCYELIHANTPLYSHAPRRGYYAATTGRYSSSPRPALSSASQSSHGAMCRTLGLRSTERRDAVGLKVPCVLRAPPVLCACSMYS